MSLKTENSRRVAKSRPVCKDLKGPHRPDAIRQRDANYQFQKSASRCQIASGLYGPLVLRAEIAATFGPKIVGKLKIL
jgi:hypothetical protein